MADRGRPTAGWRETALIVVGALAASAAMSVSLGQDLNGDLLNYHLYNGYAFLHHRLDQDLAAAGPAVSFFNPLLDALHYAGMEHLTPKAFGALLGALQGLNTVLIWAIARAVLGGRGVWLAPVAALLGVTGQNAVSLLGTTFGDNTVSIPALAAVFVLLAGERPRPGRFALAGFLGGVAVGLKLTMVAPHVGLTALAVWLAVRWRRPRLVGAFVLGTLAGWAVTDGWWVAALWSRFGNPVFPFANGIFHSPFGPARNVADPRWSARGLLGWLGPPVDAALGVPYQLQEVPLRDPRLLAVFVALLPWLVGQLRRVRAARDLIRGDLLVWWVSAYGAWLALFHYYRYATVLEMLAPTLALLLLGQIWPGRPRLTALAVAASLLLSTSVSPWWRTGRWFPFWFEPQIPRLGQQADLLVLLPEESTSFMVPFFHPDVAFIGLQDPALRGPRMTGAIAARIGAHRGPFAALLKSWSDERTEEAIRPFGLRMTSPCERVLMGRGWRYRLCPLRRPDRARVPDATAAAASSSP
jgi:hypothetical protein